MKITQHSCREFNKLDLRQAEAIKRHKPDIVIFEAPSKDGIAETVFNNFTPNKKPIEEIKKIKNNLQKVSERYKWVESDIQVFDNIVDLWNSGHDVKLYNVDGPGELLSLTIENEWNLMDKPRRRGSLFAWWVYIYLREVIMTQYVEEILESAPKDSRVLIFLQKFHWLNVQFQMNNKNKKDIYNYYFGKFDKISMKNIDDQVKELGIPELYKNWKKYSHL